MCSITKTDKFENFYITFFFNNIFVYYIKENWLFFLNTLKNIKKINIINLTIYVKFFFSRKLIFGKSDYDLKGVNYWFNMLTNKVFLDLGNSHFQILKFPVMQYLIRLKKKKQKKLLFITFNSSAHKIISNFFWFNLWSVGPYKLKGFQFVNEWVHLKEGKKPFK